MRLLLWSFLADYARNNGNYARIMLSIFMMRLFHKERLQNHDYVTAKHDYYATRKLLSVALCTQVSISSAIDGVV